MTTTLLLAFSLAAGAASAQTQAPVTPAATAQVDARFANWLGCWRLEDDLAGTGARLCITPDNPGVRLHTIVGKVGGGDEAIRADGVTRPITDPECKGTERAEWSSDGQRVFRHTDVTCGNEPPRRVSSIAFVMAGPAFINVQLVEGGPNQTVRVQRYRRSFDQTLADGSAVLQYLTSTAARATTADDGVWTVEDVIEAAGKVPGPAVQAAVAESKGRFIINKKSLVALADAGVTETTIDLMVGLAYPDRFVVERRGGSSSSAVGISMGGGYYDPFMTPALYGSMYANCYGDNGWGYRSYYYSSCGAYSPYYGGGYYGGYYPYYPGGGWVVVDPNPPGGGTPAVEGRVVNGRGYTQVRPRESEPAPRVSDGGNGTRAGHRGASSGGVSSQGYSGGSSGSASGSSGPSGSSGSNGSSGGRTAVPRPPGGGN